MGRQREKLDLIDRNILSGLQTDGRITNVQLAQDVGISAPPCLRRVRALEEKGYIKGYHAVVDSQMLGYGVTVFAQVGLASQSDADLQTFIARLDSWENVRECHMLAGDYDFLLKIVAKDWESYQEFLTSELTAAPNVNTVKSSLAIRATKNQPGVPIPGEE